MSHQWIQNFFVVIGLLLVVLLPTIYYFTNIWPRRKAGPNSPLYEMFLYLFPYEDRKEYESEARLEAEPWRMTVLRFRAASDRGAVLRARELAASLDPPAYYGSLQRIAKNDDKIPLAILRNRERTQLTHEFSDYVNHWLTADRISTVIAF